MISLILSSLIAVSGSKPALFLRYADSNFVISTTKNGPASERIDLNNDENQGPQSIEYRKDQVFVVWDDRGLTVRDGRFAQSTQFKAVPTSPRLRTRDDIIQTLKDQKSKGLSFNASALSGSVRIGDNIYGIARWTDSSHTTWLECLFSVNLASKNPTPTVLTVLPGQTFSNHFIGHSMFIDHQFLAAYIKLNGTWGKWDYDPNSGKVQFQQVGKNPVAIEQYPNGDVGFVEKSSIDSYYAGIFDPTRMVRECVQEFNNQPKFLTGSWPPIVTVNQRGQRSVVNLEKGSTLFFSKDSQIKDCQAGVIIWTGMSNPQKAWLFSVAEWQPMAWWSNPSASQ